MHTSSKTYQIGPYRYLAPKTGSVHTPVVDVNIERFSCPNALGGEFYGNPLCVPTSVFHFIIILLLQPCIFIVFV